MSETLQEALFDEAVEQKFKNGVLKMPDGRMVELSIPDDLEDLEIPTPEELHAMIVALKFRVTKLEEEIHVD